MKIRITLSSDELDMFDTTKIGKKYINRDGSFRIYFNSLEDFQNALILPGK